MKHLYTFCTVSAYFFAAVLPTAAANETVLFTEDFATVESMGKFQTIDGDGDGETWNYFTINECARSTVPNFAQINDWLITPAFNVKQGNYYQISFSTEGNYGGVLEVAYGDEATEECLSQNILVSSTTLDGNQWQNLTTGFNAKSDGQCYFAFHSLSAEWLSTLDIDNITITEIAPDSPTLYGTIAYTDDKSAPMGIYSFEPQEEITLTEVATRTDYIANGGGVYVDGKYYFTCFITGGTSVMCFYNIYDMETGTVESIINEGRVYVASDMAYDPTTGNVYCCSVANNDGDLTYVFSTMDLATGAKTAIADIEPMMVIAAGTDGTIYGISNDGILHTIDKWTGETKEIGNTGVGNLNYLVQSGIIDPSTGTFYWAAATKSGSGLYEVNIETGKASLIGNFSNNEHISGMFVTNEFFNSSAPDSPSDLTLSFNEGGLTGTINFTAPTYTVDGSELPGTLSVNVMVDGKAVTSTAQAQPGEKMEIPVTVDDEGFHWFTVSTGNESGNGKPVSTRAFIGYDTPMPVTDLTLESRGNGEMYVSWTAPTQGINGGYVDSETMTYAIQRYPDYEWIEEECTATEYTDMIETTYHETYSYGIVATSHGKQSEMVVSNFVTVGDELQIPFLETFEVEPRFAAWTVIDANNDDITWVYSYEDRAATYEFWIEDADDWLISPRFSLAAGTSYEMTIDARNSIPGEAERMEVFLGTSPDVEGMTQEILPLTEIDDAYSYQTLKRTFTVAASGTYYLGTRVSSESHIGDLMVKNIGVSVSSTGGVETATGKQAPTAWSEDGRLHVNNCTDSPATVYTINGIATSTIPAHETRILDLPCGFYIVSFGNKSIKVAVSQ